MSVGATTTSSRFTSKFMTNSNDTRTITIPNPKTGLTSSEAGAFMTAMVENGDAFADALTSGISAELITTTKTVLVDNS